MGRRMNPNKKRLPKKVEVCYCKDCKHFGIYDYVGKRVLKLCMYYNNQYGYEDWYCPEGEKREPGYLMSCIGGPLVDLYKIPKSEGGYK